MEMEKNFFKKMTFSLNSVTMGLKKSISIYLQLKKKINGPCRTGRLKVTLVCRFMSERQPGIKWSTFYFIRLLDL